MQYKSAKRQIFFLFGLVLTVVAGVFVAHYALAGTTVDQAFGLEQVKQTTILSSQDIRLTIAKIIRAALGLLGIVALGIVLYGGYLYMTALGNAEQVSTA